MMESRAIVTLCVGDSAEKQLALTGPFMQHYARRYGADLVVCRKPPAHPEVSDPFTALMLAKLDLMREALVRYDRALWLDADALVRPDCPNLFDLVPPTHWAAFDECAVALEKPGWMHHVRTLHDHMVKVCREEGLPIPDTKGRSFNCGVQLASKAHAFLYDPATRPGEHGWAEQSLINVRLFLRPETPIYCLPDAFNCMAWYWRKNYLANNWIIHYCGMPQQWRRTEAMASDAGILYARYGGLLED